MCRGIRLWGMCELAAGIRQQGIEGVLWEFRGQIELRVSLRNCFIKESKSKCD